MCGSQMWPFQWWLSLPGDGGWKEKEPVTAGLCHGEKSISKLRMLLTS